MVTPAITTRLDPDALVLSPGAPAGFSPESSPELRHHVAAHGVVVPIAVRRLSDRTYEILAWPHVWTRRAPARCRRCPSRSWRI